MKCKNTPIPQDAVPWDQIQWDQYDPLALHQLTAADSPAARAVADLVAFLLGINANALNPPDPALLEVVIHELEQTAEELRLSARGKNISASRAEQDATASEAKPNVIASKAKQDVTASEAKWKKG